jgi:hypothetical protein
VCFSTFAHADAAPKVTVDTSHLYSPSGTIIFRFKIKAPEGWTAGKWNIHIADLRGTALERPEWKPDLPGYVTETVKPVGDVDKLSFDYTIDGDVCNTVCYYNTLSGHIVK